MKELTVRDWEGYLQELYGARATEQSMFMKLVEEMGEIAEVLNIRAGRKAGEESSNEALGMELVDLIHYAVAIAAINHIDLADAILEKDRQAAVKYHHSFDLEDFLSRKEC